MNPANPGPDADDSRCKDGILDDLEVSLSRGLSLKAMSGFGRSPGGWRRRPGPGSSATAALPLFSPARETPAMSGSDRSLPGVPTPASPSRTDVSRQPVRSRACDAFRHALAGTTAWTGAAWSTDLHTALNWTKGH